MKIGIIDADLLGRKKHRFPNLACQKIAGYYKEKGAEVNLLTDYYWADDYDQVYISKVFTDTPIPSWVNEIESIHIGGTGVHFDKAPNLPNEIEHHMPDYTLYDDWIETQVEFARKKAEDNNKKFNEVSYRRQFKEYTDYSIGFITRGCFRKCKFCVNQKYDHVFSHSPLEEFYNEGLKKICLLDDNFLGYPNWKELLEELIATNKPFKFKQGLDERLLTEEKCEMLFNSKYDGAHTFAFDNIADYDLIESKLKLIRKYTNSTNVMFYVLTGFESTDAKDIENAFIRIKLLMKYKCLPYIMRYRGEHGSPWEESKYRGMYIAIARWGNQPSIFKKMSFRQFCELDQSSIKTEGRLSASMKAMLDFEKENPKITQKYFDIRFEDIISTERRV